MFMGEICESWRFYGLLGTYIVTFETNAPWMDAQEAGKRTLAEENVCEVL